MSKKFHRREVHKRKKLSMAWRKPKGMHSKVRRKEKKTFKMPDPGFMKQKEKRFKHPSGLNIIRIYSKKDFERILEERKKEINNFVFVLSSKLSKKSLKEIFQKALKFNIRIANAKKIEERLKKIEEELKERKKKSKEREKKKKERKEKAKKKEKEEKEKTTSKTETSKSEIKNRKTETKEEKSVQQIKKTTKTVKETKSFKGDSNRGR